MHSTPATADTRPDPLATVTHIREGLVHQFPTERKDALNLARGLVTLADHNEVDAYTSVQYWEGGRIAWEYETRGGQEWRNSEVGMEARHGH